MHFYQAKEKDKMHKIQIGLAHKNYKISRYTLLEIYFLMDSWIRQMFPKSFWQISDKTGFYLA